MISWHKVGQKVACIDDSFVDFLTLRHASGLFNDPDLPQADEVYTVSGLVLAQGRVGFVLVEFPLVRRGFNPCRFRPVYPTVVDDLRKLCAPSSEPVRVDA